jgi:hypothetical protein
MAMVRSECHLGGRYYHLWPPLLCRFEACHGHIH